MLLPGIAHVTWSGCLILRKIYRMQGAASNFCAFLLTYCISSIILVLDE